MIFSYIFESFKATFFQLLILLGPIIVLGLIMNFISGSNEKSGVKLFGLKTYLYVFAWLGTAIHELGHAVFAVIFGHRITEISLFSPDFKTGTLGYVNHSYSKNSIYQNIGNFFIGIGPIILGSACIYFISIALFGSEIISFNINLNYESFFTTEAAITLINEIYGVGTDYFYNVFFSVNSKIWKTIVLVYVLFSVGSSLKLSPEDFSTAKKGLFYFAIVLLIFNLSTLWLGNFTENAFLYTGKILSPIYALIILSILINTAFLIILKILHLIFR